MSFLILTKLQADAVRGETSPGALLAPVELANGTYCLPDRVLSDPAHASKHGVLNGFPRAETVIPKVVPE